MCLCQLVWPSISMGDPVNAKRYGTSERPWRSERWGPRSWVSTFDSRSFSHTSYAFSCWRDLKKQNHQNHHQPTCTAFACKLHQISLMTFLCGAKALVTLRLSSAPSLLSIIVQLASLNDIFASSTILRSLRLIPPYLQFWGNKPAEVVSYFFATILGRNSNIISWFLASLHGLRMLINHDKSSSKVPHVSLHALFARHGS